MQTQNNTKHRAAVITPGRVFYGDGTTAELRAGIHNDLAAILAGVTGRFATHSTVIIDGVDVRTYIDQGGAVRRGGWNHRSIGPWSVLHRSDGTTCAVGIRQSMLPAVHFGPLFGRDTDPGVVAVVLDRYQQATGHAWRGTFATTALNGIRLTCGNSDGEPRWKAPRIGRISGAGVLDWRRWLTSREREWGWVHTFDASRAYLWAAGRAELAWSELEHTGPRPFDARLPGYWRLELGEATRAGLADPQRPPILTKVDDGAAWMTTPMAALVVELDPSCVVLDSHTGRPHGHHPAGLPLLRPWAAELREAFSRVDQLGAGVRDTLATAVKRTYKDAIGGMQRAGMRIERPDWAHTIIDCWRAALYRRIVAVKATQGVWPVRVHTDSLAYADGVDRPQKRGTTAPIATLTDELGVAGCECGCECGCGCSRAATAIVGRFRHQSTTGAGEWP